MAMTAADRLGHDVPGTVPRRHAAAAGVRTASAENLSAASDSLGQALRGWRHSPPHDAKAIVLPDAPLRDGVRSCTDITLRDLPCPRHDRLIRRAAANRTGRGLERSEESMINSSERSSLGLRLPLTCRTAAVLKVSS
jgi:hypothetical protein